MQHQTYMLTFEDGSEAYLVHYGVKGMKWGNWNAETKAKYANDGQNHNQQMAGGGGYVDDEYEKEKAYNSRKNEYPPDAANDRRLNDRLINVNTKHAMRDSSSIVKNVGNAAEYAVHAKKEYLKNVTNRAVIKGLSRMRALALRKPSGKTLDSEYEKEKAYNSRRNEYSPKAAKTRSSALRKPSGKTLDSEYEKEKAYNSRKNRY